VRRPSIVIVLVLAAGIMAAMATSRSAAQGDNLIARGSYLVGPAGRCADCHGENLHGQFLGFLKPGMPVSYNSANIAGLKQLSTAAAVTFMATGALPNGKQAAPPMPQYRFNTDDARAIVAYLKSLK
jgi:mono/diheme cytochrome c family protein